VPIAALVNAVVTEGENSMATGTEKRDGVIDAADVGEYTREADFVTKSRPTAMVENVRDTIAKPSTVSVALPVEAVREHDATDVISLADTIMSVDGSSSNGDQSPSTCGSSVSAIGTRKRLGEEIPERECGEGSRRGFPGLITRSAAGCRVYILNTGSDKGDYPGRVLNDDGTFAVKVTMGQDCEPRVDEEGEIATSACNVNKICGPRDAMSGEKTKFIPPSPSMPALSLSIITSTPDPVLYSTIAPRSQHGVTSTTDFLFQTEDVPELPAGGADGSVVMNPSASETNRVREVVLIDEFGRDTCIVNEVCQLLEDMPRLWSAYRAFEAVHTARFPNIDRAALRLTVLAVLMGQRRCAIRMTTAGLNSACADDYRNSY